VRRFQLKGEMTKAKKNVGSFWIDLHLHHPSCDPGRITQELRLEPSHSAKVGSQMTGTILRKSTVWMVGYREGSTDSEFTQALGDCIDLLEAHRGFFQSLVNDGGDILFKVNQIVDYQKGIMFSLWLESSLLEALGRNKASLEIQAWSSETEE
jgi:hypothetical protein